MGSEMFWWVGEVPEKFCLAAVVASAVEVGRGPGGLDSNDWSAAALAVMSCRIGVQASAGLQVALLASAGDRVMLSLWVRWGGKCHRALALVPLRCPCRLRWAYEGMVRSLRGVSGPVPLCSGRVWRTLLI